MNWDEIKKKYPKAVELIYECADKYAIGAFIDDYKYNRLLYDLFDEQGVYINISTQFHEDNIKMWDFYIIGDDGWNLAELTYEFTTRTEAEEKAFTKAFEILEEKLK